MIVGLFWSSAADIEDFIVTLSTLFAFSDFLQDYDFVMIIKGDFNTVKKFPKNHFIS